MTRVVSITSVAVERDSRTYKMAASIARLGYDSVVIEGAPSRSLPDGLPFRLLSLPPGDGERPSQAVGDAEPDSGSARIMSEPGELAEETAESEVRIPLLVRLGQRLPGSVAEPLRRVWRPLRRSFIGSSWGIWGLVRYRMWARLRDPPYILFSNVRDLIRGNRETGALLPDADVYWLHSFPQFPSVYLKARRGRARLFYDTPDAYWEPGQSPALNRAERVVLRGWQALEARAVRRAESFTSVSDGVAGLLEERFGRRPRVIRNSHDLRLDQPVEEAVRTVTGVGPEHFLLVMTGNLKPGTAVDEALLALQRLPERVHLAFVGRGHDQSRPRVEELGLSGRVHLLPPVPPTQVVEFIGGADASPILYRAATTNYLYALPNGFFHAVAAGLPILYPPLPEIEALARRHQLGVGIDPSDPDSIAAAIRSLLDDPDAQARFRANSERAREELSWEHEEEILAGLLG